MLLAGLTGGIGSGKSTVAAGLATRGATIIDADLIAREVVLPGGPAYDPIVDRFGPAVLLPDGTVNRPALASVVFADPDARRDLNRITHPAIGAGIMARLAAVAQGTEVVILDIPLLAAATIEIYGLRAVVVVDTPEEVAIRRLVAGRGFREADARARIAAQISREQRRDLVDLVATGVVIDNGGDRRDLEAGIDHAWAVLRSVV